MDSVPGEGAITYDICFYAMVPGGEHIKLIINVEAQKSFYPGYDLVTRAVFYCARLLSAQCGTEFTPKNYDDIKKVYSIWICMDVPKEMEYTISKYRMVKEDVYGCVPNKARYDLLEVVMVYLGKNHTAEHGNELHGLLSTLLSDELEPAEKKKILEQEYGIATSVEMEGGLQKMCNLSEMIEENAERRLLISLVNDGLLSEEKAASRSGLSVLDFRELMETQNNEKDEIER